jgi:hypothetical protein
MSATFLFLTVIPAQIAIITNRTIRRHFTTTLLVSAQTIITVFMTFAVLRSFTFYIDP